MKQKFETVDLAIETINPAVAPVETEDSVDSCSDAFAAIQEKVISLSREFLSDGALSALDTVQSLHVVEAHLTVIV